jgi:uncharacterized protein
VTTFDRLLSNTFILRRNPNMRIVLVSLPACLLAGLAVMAVEPAAEPASRHPRIAGHGAIVRLPLAVEQPREGTKIVVDVVLPSADDQVNDALKKLARHVNVYAGAGAEPASVRIAAVLHGDATFVSLSDATYARRFDGKTNPNVPLLRELKAAGVEFLVCGQALSQKGFEPADADKDVSVAVSAVSAIANRQMDGYVLFPLQ